MKLVFLLKRESEQQSGEYDMRNAHYTEFTMLYWLAFIYSGCCFQDSGAFLCVIDDSNEHMLSVWDCNKGTKHAEVKVKNNMVIVKCKWTYQA